MFEAVKSPCLVPFNDDFQLSEASTLVKTVPNDKKYKKRLEKLVDELDELWQQRYESIRDHEKHLARNGTVVLKFWLNVSRDEQRKRFLSRLDAPQKNWKFSSGDIDESSRWKDYMNAYEKALNATSRPWAPWYAIPADDKSYARLQVAEIVVESLKSLNLQYPEVSKRQLADIGKMRELLEKPL